MNKVTLENGTTVVILKLTVKQIDSWLENLAEEAASPRKQAVVDSLLFEDIDLLTVSKMVAMPEDDLRELTPDDVNTIIEGCKTANKHFFKMREKMIQFGAKALENQQEHN